MDEETLALLSKAFPFSSFIPRYINGLQITNDSLNPHTVLNISEGSTTDSTGIFQIGLSESASINTALTGIGGLDTGTLAASKLYAIYLVADPVKQQPSGCIFSLSLTGPLMPFSYSAYKLIGYFAVDGSKNILQGYWTAGDSSNRTFMYDDDNLTQVLTNGNSTTFLDVLLTNYVPAQQNMLVWIFSDYKGATAGNVFILRPSGSLSEGQAGGVAQNTTTSIDNLFLVNIGLNGSGLPAVQYGVTASGDALNLYVNGYNFII